MKITTESIVSANPKNLSTSIGADQVILDTSNNLYFGLEDVASRIWELLSGKHQVSDIVELIEEEYEVDNSRCREDVLSFLEDLHLKGLIEIAD